jgi:hypothetical protein
MSDLELGITKGSRAMWRERALELEALLEAEHGHEHTLGLAAKVRIDQLTRQVEEERRRHDAEIRAKDEAIGELLGLVGCPHCGRVHMVCVECW